MRETVLNSRVLRFDGVSIGAAEELKRLILSGVEPHALRFRQVDEEIQKFNAAAGQDEIILADDPSEEFIPDTAWLVPADFVPDVEEWLRFLFHDFLDSADQAKIDEYELRFEEELEEFRRHSLMELLRTMVFIKHIFRENSQIHGVGRGSSCASFLLFLIGIHKVDPVKFDISIEEFLHD